MAPAGFKGMRLRGRCGTFPPHMGDILTDQPIERHDAPDRAGRETRLREQAPDPKLPGIWVRFLEVIDLHHDGQPALARRLGPPAFVH